MKPDQNRTKKSAMKRVTPVVPSDNVGTLLSGMAQTGFQGRKLGESVAIWRQMLADPDCTIFFGLSGAMIPAGMQQCLIEMVKRHYVDVIVSTGANIFHDTCEHLGVCHYIGHHQTDDHELYKRGIDRIYDVFAFEEEFRTVDRGIASWSASLAPFRGSSREFISRLGKWLSEEKPGAESLTSVCANEKVPIFIPALADSSIGIGLLIARRRGLDINIDQIADADEITSLVEEAKCTGVIYVGGGVPKNFIQQTQVIGSIHEKDLGGHKYAIQYTTDSPQWGGLSGCTFEEGISWGKESATSSQVQAHVDATIALPLVISALVASGAKRVRRSRGKKKVVYRQGID
ncbi:deoxyhypusine synthase [Methanoregula sp.]|uniref:deoxyhypusine synthase n=1 Tax=Methanoregula sp. TaxID=2052170 RepID=UPI0026275D6D|nr:deoxyhypusine synthase [Methanoregula sp.]MDD5143869.1 deoxyhypusine synthase [Methanoregula sp.]